MRWTALWADLRRDCSLLAAEESGLYVGRSSWWCWWSTSSSSSTNLQDCVDGGEVAAAAANDDDAEILEDLFCIFGFRERERERVETARILRFAFLLYSAVSIVSSFGK